MASYGDTLTSLMEGLVRLVGAPTAVTIARKIPQLVVDAEGNVLDYDHDDPRNTARLLIEHYQAAFGEITTKLAEQTIGDFADNVEASTPSPSPTTILVVDDHVLVRDGLVGLIDPQPDMHVVGQAGSVREAITLAHKLHPNLILMDFTLPDGKGDEAARVILAALPNTKIVFLTVHDDDERLFAAVAAGASGYLLKSIRSADLVSRLRGVIHGDVALSPSIGRRILAKFSRLPIPTTPDTDTVQELTEREREILRFIAQGHTNRQIAGSLNLSIRTVEYHRANLTSKIGFHNRADLVRYAAEHGLLETKKVHQKLDSDLHTKE